MFVARSVDPGIYVKMNFAGPARTIALVVTPNTKVEDIKYRLEESEGLPVDEQRIVFEGTQLHDSKTLGSYGVHAGVTVQLMGRFGGDDD